MKKISSVISLLFLVLLLLLFVNPVNVYSLKSEQNVEPSRVTSIKPDSKVWENFYHDNCYYNKTNIVKSDNSVTVWIYIVRSDGERKK